MNQSMKYHRSLRHKIILPVLLVIMSVTVLPQGSGETFDDPDIEYTLKLPPKWTAVVSKDGLGRKDVIIVYGSAREDGALRIRRTEVEAGTTIEEAANREENQSLRFKPGYSKGAVENFAANYKAILISYDYTQAGRPKMGRTYYLLVNDTTLYAMHFTGNRSSLGPLRAHTDLLARSFKLK